MLCFEVLKSNCGSLKLVKGLSRKQKRREHCIFIDKQKRLASTMIKHFQVICKNLIIWTDRAIWEETTFVLFGQLVN